MPKVFTTCLVTGQPIDTGIDIDDGSIARHEWSKDNARVVDGETPKS